MPFLSFLLSSTSTILISVLVPLGVLLCAGLSVLFLFYRRKKAYRDVQEKFRRINYSFLELSRKLLNRLKALGEYSPDFKKTHQEKEKQFAEILTKKDKKIQEDLSRLEKLKEAKKGKEFRALLSEVQKSVSAFERTVQNFNEDLTGLLREDDEARESAIPAKEKFRRIREFYGKHVEELRPLQESFNLLFANAEDVFAQFSDDVSKARFDDAKKRIPPIEKVLDAVLSLLDDLPATMAKVNAILPEGLEDLERQYRELLSQDYVLDHLRVPEFLSSSRASLETLRQRLVVLDTRGMAQELDSIQEGIDSLLTSFEKERQAKANFLLRQDALSDSSFRLEKRYSLCCNQLPEYRRTYLLREGKVQELVSLKEDIDRIGYLKRELVSFVDTSQRRPYTVIMKCISEMDEAMKKATLVLDSYSDYLSSLKQESQRIHGELRRLYLALLDCKGRLQRLSNDVLDKRTEKIFPALFESLTEIDKILYQTPVDVEKAHRLFVPFQEKAEKFLSELRLKFEEEAEAQKAILAANVFRDDFQDSRAMIQKAEACYREGQFQQAKRIADEVRKTFTAQAETTNE